MNLALGSRVLTLALVCLAGATAAAQDVVTSVDQLRTVASLGGTYTLGAGSFDVYGPIQVSRDLVLIGQGTAATTILVAEAPAGLSITNGATVRIEGVDFSRLAEGSPSSDLIHVLDGHLDLADLSMSYAKSGDAHPLKSEGLGSALFLAGDSSAVLTGVVLERNGLAAVEVVDRATLTLRDSTVTGNAYGVYVTDDGTVTVEGSRFERTIANAINAQGRAKLNVAGSEFIGNGATLDMGDHEYDAVRVGAEATANFTRNTFLTNPRYALSLFGTALVTTEENRFENNGGYDTTANLYYSALLVEESAELKARGDTYFANPGGAIELAEEATSTFHGVRVERTGSYASIYGESSGATRFVDLMAVDNEGCVCLYAGTVTFEGGTHERNGDDAIYADGVETLIVTGVTFSHQTGAAVSTYDTAHATVNRNTLMSNGSGILIGPNSTATVTDNSFEGGGSSGPAIAFHATAGGVVSGNRIRQTGSVNAIYIQDAGRVRVEGNDVADSD